VKLLPLALSLLLGSPLFAQATPPLRIGKVTIRNLDVYTAHEASRGRFYRTADRLHIETKPSVIERFLLFHEGDEYRPERLAETERNLRTLRFLKSASVTASPPHDGVVDVTVTTQDSWSISPETQGGSKGGASTYGVNLSDGNVFGYGKDISVGWDKGADRSRSTIEYNDPSFFAPYWNAKVRYGSNSDGYEHRMVVTRPFYSFATPWAADFVYDGLRQADKLYADGLEVERFRQKHRLMIASAGMALDPNDALAQRLTAGVRIVRDEFFTLTGAPAERLSQTLPDGRDFRYLFVRYDRVENDFVKLNFVNKDLRFEDFNLGRQFSAETALSPSALGTDRTVGFARVGLARGRRVSDDGFVLPSISAETRLDSGIRNAIVSSSMMFVHRIDVGDYPRTFVARATALSGWRTDRDLQFFADGMTGLRGYRMHTFEGNRAFIVNVEERLYLGREILQLASPGVVAFADFGNATYGGVGQLMSLKSDVGFGFRMGLPRTPKNLLRLDFAYALNRDPLGRRGWLISFSSGQAF
jgi:hypothetical protein